MLGENELKFTVLSDNIEYANFCAEWGFSLAIEYKGVHFLLDTGASPLFSENAKLSGIHLDRMDFAVLSHAHYDHSDGMAAFFENNQKAKLYMRKGAAENCYKITDISLVEGEGAGNDADALDEIGENIKYIGIEKGLLERFQGRLVYAEGIVELMPGVNLLPHSTPGLSKIGIRESMYIRVGGKFIPDDFRHEQSLVFETQKGLVIFNSCSHGGADNIIREVGEAFPDKKLYAMIGGFHLFTKTEEEVRAFAKRVEATGIEKVITGHCTGDEAMVILKEELGEKVQQLHAGLIVEL